MHPKQAGRPVLAIECDGASYHSSATARDRDRLRQAHLEKLGWRFHRIWSTDWFYSREEEIQRALASFNDAVQRADRQDQDDKKNQKPKQVVAVNVQVPAPQIKRVPKPLIPDRDSIDHYTDNELLALANWVASDGLLRTEGEMIREIFKLLPFSRMGVKIRTRLEETIRKLKQYPKKRA